MKIMKLRRISDPSVSVDVMHRDHGDKVPWYDVNGKSFRAFTSEFSFEGDVFYTQAKTAEARFENDCAALASRDLDLRAWVEVVQRA